LANLTLPGFASPATIDLRQPIAVGRTAEVFALGQDRVVKLLRDGFPAILVDQEALGTRAARRAGISAPEPGEIVEIGRRRGLILERVEGPTLVQEVSRRPYLLVKYSRLLGRLHAQITAASALDLPSQKARYIWQLNLAARLPADMKNAVLKMLEGLPDGDRLCHGDFHPENVIISRRGPVILDWEPAMRGSPAGDVATTCLWIRSVMTYFTGVKAGLFGQFARLSEAAYLSEYRKFASGDLDQLEDWIAVRGATRYCEDDRTSFTWLERLIRKRLGRNLGNNNS